MAVRNLSTLEAEAYILDLKITKSKNKNWQAKSSEGNNNSINTEWKTIAQNVHVHTTTERHTQVHIYTSAHTHKHIHILINTHTYMNI